MRKGSQNMGGFQKTQSLSVVVPAFNEEAIIERSIVLLNGKLNTFAEDYEIIVVDDHSSDATLAILKSLTAKIPQLKVMHNSTNQGLGGALRKGFSIASKKLVFYTDADLPIDYEDIGSAITILRENDVDFVAGFRNTRSSEPINRIIYSLVYNWLICILFKVKIKDINFSLKLVKREILEKLHLQSNGLFIDAEMILKTKYLGYTIKRIGATYFPRENGRSKLATPKVILNTLYEMFKYYLEVVKIH